MNYNLELYLPTIYILKHFQFPNGLDRVQQETGWPVVAHNRYWSGLTNYSTENGGDYHFIIGTYYT